MDHLWSPWRYQYVQKSAPEPGCIFCRIVRERANDAENFVVHRATRNLIVLNLYPYTTGHLMVGPYEHVDNLEAAPVETLEEMIRLARDAQGHLRRIYKPGGFNLGMNIAESAGAGIAEHIHLHVLPRWAGDTNFMTTVGETRVLPEELAATYAKLKKAFGG